jgi:butyryl-CoA dehydrogenase
MNFALTADQEQLKARAEVLGRSFAEHARTWDESDNAPYHEIFDCAREAGLLGIAMPEAYGGQGGNAIEYLIVVEALFRYSQSWLPPEPVFCTSGPGPAIILLGDDPVKDKYLNDIVSGHRACNIALTEPGAGSALTHLETAAVRDGEHFVLNGTKSFLTASNVNDLNATFVRFDDLPGSKGIGAVVVDSTMPGVTLDRGPTFIGDRGIAHGNMTLSDVRIPIEDVIVGPGQFPRLMTAFNLERLHNCGLWLGLAQAAYDEAAKYTQHREAFGKPILDFQAVYHSLADMWVQIEALRLLAYRAATSAIDGRFPRLGDVTQAKLFGATVGPQISLRAMELHGGYGATLDFPIQRIHRDCVTSVVAGGAPAVLRNGVAAGLFPNRRFPQT